MFIVLDNLKMMNKKIVAIWMILFVAMSSFGQEICDNGIDDDHDGLIDLNDVTDCACNTLTSSNVVTSLIPNPSFEEHTGCPVDINDPDNSGVDEFLKCNGWQEATNGTVDYMHTCGFVHPAVSKLNLEPFPDGDAIIGLLLTTFGMEAVGSCLNSPLLAGTSYSLKFNVASMNISVVDKDTLILDNYGELNLTLYGAKDCSSFPLPNTLGCPTADNTDWVELGSVLYVPKPNWGEVIISFTPSTDINTVILTGPCELPSDYPGLTDVYFDNAPVPYFLIDNLILNKTSSFDLLAISKTGSYCTNDLVLTTTVPVSAPQNSTLQWYKDGIAIVGATGTSYSVVAGLNGVGNYQVRLTDGIVCGLSDKMTILQESAPVISLTSDVSILLGDSVALTASGGTNYSWSPATNLSCADCANPVASPTNTTEYCVEVTNGNPCSSTKCVTVKINFPPQPCGDLFIPNSFSPNGDNKNDLLEVKINAACVEDYNFQIFDRWGELMFESTKISNSWDGKHNGKELDNAVFVYHLKMKMVDTLKTIEKKGNISIIK